MDREPGMNSYEVAKRLRANPAKAGLVLSTVTGYGQEEDVRRSRFVGVEPDSLRGRMPRSGACGGELDGPDDASVAFECPLGRVFPTHSL